LSEEEPKSGDDKSDTAFDGKVMAQGKGAASSSARYLVADVALKDFAECISWWHKIPANR
jgi:hypothetical protein